MATLSKLSCLDKITFCLRDYATSTLNELCAVLMIDAQNINGLPCPV